MNKSKLLELVKEVVKLAPEMIPSLIKLLKHSDTQTMVEMFQEEHKKIEEQRKSIDALIDDKFPPEES